MKLDHVGIAVRSIEDRMRAYGQGLGLPATAVEEVPSEQVKVVFLPVGETRLELLEPTSDSSPIARFLQRRGEGIHHLCLAVEDLEATLDRLRRLGVALVEPAPRPGAGGSTVAFVHPRGTGGVLLELKQASP